MTQTKTRLRDTALVLDGPARSPDESADVASCRARAERGDAVAQFNLGKCYQQGSGVEPDDRAAGDWFAKSASQGYPPALCEFGTLVLLGRGTERDILQAAQLHLSAASAGDATAHGKLSDYRDELVSMALAGNREAAFDLHRIHAEGLGACKAPALGWAWIRWAVEKCPPLPDGEGRCDDLDEEVAAVHGFFKAGYDAPTRKSGNLEFKALAKAAKQLAKIGAPGSAGQCTPKGERT